MSGAENMAINDERHAMSNFSLDEFLHRKFAPKIRGTVQKCSNIRDLDEFLNSGIEGAQLYDFLAELSEAAAAEARQESHRAHQRTIVELITLNERKIDSLALGKSLAHEARAAGVANVKVSSNGVSWLSTAVELS